MFPISRASIWLVGLLPLLSAEFAIATSARLVSTSLDTRLAQPLHCAEVDALITEATLNTAVQQISACEVTGELVSDLVTVLERQGDPSQLITPRLVALHSLIVLAERHPGDTVLSTELSTLVNAIEPLLASEQLVVRNAASISLSTLVIHSLRQTESLPESVGSDGVLQGMQALWNSLNVAAEATDSSVEGSILTWEALRDIGYALQSQVTADSNQSHPYTSISEDITRNIAALLVVPLHSEENLPPQAEDLRVVQLEALSAFLFMGPLTDPLLGSDVNGLQLLNQVAANEEETTLVRATAIASLERLGFQEPFGQLVQKQLRQIAETTALPISQRISALEVVSRIADYRIQQQPPITTPLTTPWPRTDGPDPEESNSLFYVETPPPPGISFATSLNLLSLLQDGLSSEGEEDVRQRAEIAFDQIYSRNFQQLYQAVAYVAGSGDATLRKRAVEALGAVNYRQLPEPDYLSGSTDANASESEFGPPPEAVIVRFLGHNLLCSRDVEVRRDAAYALAQIAPHWPNVLAQTELEPFWYNLPEADIGELSDPSLSSLCTSRRGSDEGKRINVLNVLALSLNDSNERVIALAAYALSRYGVALENQRQQTDLDAVLAGQEESLFSPIRTEQTPSNTPVTELRACMLALLSPSRLTTWPHDEELASRYQFLLEDYERYQDECGYELAEQGSDRSAIAAAYVLGQIGISDGLVTEESEGNEIEAVRYLLRVLQGRDLLAERALQPRFRTPSAVEQIAIADRYREDSVRDSIVRYVLGRIHPDEETLINELIAAVEFPLTRDEADPLQRELDCAYEANANTRDRICLQNSTTRAAVLGAVELIGVSDLELPPISSGSRLRRLLVQDPFSTLAQPATADVAERIGDGAQLVLEDENASSGEQVEAATNIVAVQPVLSGPLDSINSCIGATYALARTEIRDELVINQLLNYLYVYPQPLVEEAEEDFGNLCVSQAIAPDITPTEPALSWLEQIILLRTGAITALGQIKPLPPEDGLPQPHPDIPRVVRCLVNIANGELFFPVLVDTPNSQPDRSEGCPIRQGDNSTVNRLPRIAGGHSDQETEAFQAARWDLEPREYLQMKRAMQTPAIEAIGELAVAEAPEQYDALCALAFDSLETLPQECEGPRILDGWVGSIRNKAQREDFIQRRALKLQYIEATAQKLYADLQKDISNAKLQLSDLENDPRQRKLNTIIHQLLTPMLNPPLDPEGEDDSGDSLSRFESARKFRNEVLAVLSNLEPQAFSTLDLIARREILRNVGFTSGTGIYQECLSPEADLLTQERLCFGATHLLVSTWSPEFNYRIGGFTNIPTFLRELISPPESAPTARTSPLIKASALRAMGILGIYERNQDEAILFSQLNDNDSRISVAAIDAFANYPPSQIMPSIRQQLNSSNEQVAFQAIELIWKLSQRSESNWPTILQQSEIVNDLIFIANQSSASDLLRSRAIYVLGELRITDRHLVTLLKDILNSALQGRTEYGTEIQEAAAYALGQFGQINLNLGREVLPLLYNLILSSEGSAESAQATVVVAASYAIAQIGIDELALSNGINRHAVTARLIDLYNRLLLAGAADNSGNTNTDDLAALTLYAIGQFQSPEINIANIYGASLEEDLPLSVQIVAASYASSLPVWNSLLVNQLVNATQNSNVALRLSAILSLSEISERDTQNLQTQDRESINHALSAIFWQESEYAELRLAAGNGLCRILQPDAWSDTVGQERCKIEELQPNSFTDEFKNSLENLQALQNSHNDLSASRSLVELGGADGLLTLRSRSLIADLDQNLSTVILLENLDDRASNSSNWRGWRTIFNSRGRPIVCYFGARGARCR